MVLLKICRYLRSENDNLSNLLDMYPYIHQIFNWTDLSGSSEKSLGCVVYMLTILSWVLRIMLFFTFLSSLFCNIHIFHFAMGSSFCNFLSVILWYVGKWWTMKVKRSTLSLTSTEMWGAFDVHHYFYCAFLLSSWRRRHHSSHYYHCHYHHSCFLSGNGTSIPGERSFNNGPF